MNRRSILKLFGAAPVGLPVVAREAASKAGIGALGLAPDEGCYPMAGSFGSNPASEADWVTQTAKRVFSKDWENEERMRMREWYPSKLDPDLASSRSLSLSAALRIQRDRNIENRIRNERESARRSYLRVVGFDFIA